MTTSRPALASSRAAADPAGPAPTTTASTVTGLFGISCSLGRGRVRWAGHAEALGQLPQHRRGVGHDPEVSHGRHRAGRVGIHADYMVWGAEPADVLGRPGDAERDVQLRVDRHAGGADLPVVAHPARVGYHP